METGLGVQGTRFAKGFRIGVSGYRGLYLDRRYAYFFPCEANPSRLPAHGLGINANWSHRHTWAYVEPQKFVMRYTLIPNFRESAAYGELRQDISPRWFAAARYGYSCNSDTGKQHSIETGMAFRPNRCQLIKVAYEEQRLQSPDTPNHTLGIQFVTSFHRALISR